jgi:outer membrane receptor protein involved in Fe transport
MSSWYRRYIPNEEAFNAPESKIPGYSTADFLLGYQLKKQLRFFVRLNNAFDVQHGGLDAEGLDVDLPYNPQRRRHVRIGITFEPTRRK